MGVTASSSSTVFVKLLLELPPVPFGIRLTSVIPAPSGLNNCTTRSPMKVCVTLVKVRLTSPTTTDPGTVSVAAAPVGFVGLKSGIGTGGPEYAYVVGAPTMAWPTVTVIVRVTVTPSADARVRMKVIAVPHGTLVATRNRYAGPFAVVPAPRIP